VRPGALSVFTLVEKLPEKMLQADEKATQFRDGVFDFPDGAPSRSFPSLQEPQNKIPEMHPNVPSPPIHVEPDASPAKKPKKLPKTKANTIAAAPQNEAVPNDPSPVSEQLVVAPPLVPALRDLSTDFFCINKNALVANAVAGDLRVTNKVTYGNASVDPPFPFIHDGVLYPPTLEGMNAWKRHRTGPVHALVCCKRETVLLGDATLTTREPMVLYEQPWEATVVYGKADMDRSPPGVGSHRVMPCPMTRTELGLLRELYIACGGQGDLIFTS